MKYCIDHSLATFNHKPKENQDNIIHFSILFYLLHKA